MDAFDDDFFAMPAGGAANPSAGGAQPHADAAPTDARSFGGFDMDFGFGAEPGEATTTTTGATGNATTIKDDDGMPPPDAGALAPIDPWAAEAAPVPAPPPRADSSQHVTIDTPAATDAPSASAGTKTRVAFAEVPARASEAPPPAASHAGTGVRTSFPHSGTSAPVAPATGKPMPGASDEDVKSALKNVEVALEKTKGVADPSPEEAVAFDATVARLESQYAELARNATDAGVGVVKAVVDSADALGPSELGTLLGHPKASFQHLLPLLLAELRSIV
eukprot:CAMPEP_0174841964 /NCGR_PEP_ID=MMETSP1114-20130205/9635_1 /TAXON_ID=312471 /ORGANISM="Neobodo designis, Strain CCAP 1951/1" /LENGTH=277 /DNA_ID=CAMNT_0016076161 /DNA_START=104 /DNA_END=937 /DNA_ORIENTATION=+